MSFKLLLVSPSTSEISLQTDQPQDFQPLSTVYAPLATSVDPP